MKIILGHKYIKLNEKKKTLYEIFGDNLSPKHVSHFFYYFFFVDMLLGNVVAMQFVAGCFTTVEFLCNILYEMMVLHTVHDCVACLIIKSIYNSIADLRIFCVAVVEFSVMKNKCNLLEEGRCVYNKIINIVYNFTD